MFRAISLFIISLLIFASCGGGGGNSSSPPPPTEPPTHDPLANWQSMFQNVTNEWIRVIKYLNGMFIGVGNNGTIITSPDGITWNSVTSGTTKNLHDIAYGNSRYVVVGEGIFLASNDGDNWTVIDLGFNYPFNSIIYDNSIFVAVGDVGLIYTSPDGIYWENVTPGTTNDLFKIRYGNDIFVVLSRYTGSDGIILTSTDGINWISVASNFSGFFDITFGNDKFAAVKGGAIFTSTDAIQWAKKQMFEEGYPTGPAPTILYSVIYTTGKFFVNARTTYTGGGCGPNYLLNSNDGMDWTSTPIPMDLKMSTFGNSTYVSIVGWGTIFTSNDLMKWNLRNLSRGVFGECGNFQGVAYGNNIWVVSTNAGILNSSDGVNWLWKNPSLQNYELRSSLPLSISFVNGKFFGFSNDILFTSTDGLNWTEVASGINSITGNHNKVTYGNEIYLILGGNNTLYFSTDGITWEERSFSYAYLHGLTYGNNTFVLVGDLGTVLTSNNGINWTLRGSYTDTNLLDITFGNGMFVAIGGDCNECDHVVVTSSDSINWNVNILDNNIVIGNITYGNGTFVATDSDNIITSQDTVEWILRKVVVNDARLTDVIYANGTFVAIGENTLIQSESIATQASYYVDAYLNSAAHTWVDTDIYITDGMQLAINASGTGCNGPNSCTNPDGTSDYGFYNGCQIGSLVAKIGTGSQFCIGSNFQQAVSETGRLYLAYNDTDYSNNTGGYNVYVNIGS